MAQVHDLIDRIERNQAIPAAERERVVTALRAVAAPDQGETATDLARAVRDMADELRDVEQDARRLPGTDFLRAEQPIDRRFAETLRWRQQHHATAAGGYATALERLEVLEGQLNGDLPRLLRLAFDGASVRRLAQAIEGEHCPDCGGAAGPNACRYCGRGLCMACAPARELFDGTGYRCDSCRARMDRGETVEVTR